MALAVFAIEYHRVTNLAINSLWFGKVYPFLHAGSQFMHIVHKSSKAVMCSFLRLHLFLGGDGKFSVRQFPQRNYAMLRLDFEEVVLDEINFKSVAH